MEVFGHRGAAGLVPENTLAGLRRAAELGCHGVECDVRSVDGRLVLLHDPTVDRTTDGCGSLAELGAAGVRRLDAGGEPPPWVEEATPLFGEFPSLRWNLELKEPGAARLLWKEMAGWPRAVRRRAVVSSFLPEALAPWGGSRVARALCIHRPGGTLLDEARRLGCEALHLDLKGFLPRFPAVARDAGLAVRVFTVNDPATVRRLARCGVQGVFTDRPDRLLPESGRGCSPGSTP